jgi:uncharacterized damage-inducible protein DinB
MSDPRYPIGKFQYEGSLSEAQRRDLIGEIDKMPAEFRSAVRGLSAKQLDTPYREGGWTVRQLVHHVPDSHMNAYIRFKLALTEDEPTIKTYEQQLWAKLPDSESTPIEVSLVMLENLHTRWVLLLRSLNEQDWNRTLKHPELGQMTLPKTLAMYAWHGRHHSPHYRAAQTDELVKKSGPRGPLSNFMQMKAFYAGLAIAAAIRRCASSTETSSLWVAIVHT